MSEGRRRALPPCAPPAGRERPRSARRAPRSGRRRSSPPPFFAADALPSCADGRIAVGRGLGRAGHTDQWRTARSHECRSSTRVTSPHASRVRHVRAVLEEDERRRTASTARAGATGRPPDRPRPPGRRPGRRAAPDHRRRPRREGLCLEPAGERAQELQPRRHLGHLDSDRDVGQAFFRLLGNGSQQGRTCRSRSTSCGSQPTRTPAARADFDVPDDMKAAHASSCSRSTSAPRACARSPPTSRRPSAAARPARKRRADRREHAVLPDLDVVYTQRVAPLIREALDDAGVTGQAIADSQFIGNVSWLSPHVRHPARPRRGRHRRPDRPAAPGLHGHGLCRVTAATSRCSPAASSTASRPRARHLHVTSRTRATTTRRRQGPVSVRGGGQTITASKTVAQTKAGEAAVDIPLGQTPPVGTSTVTVAIAPVRGEQKTDNNRQNYTVIFTR